MQDLHQLDKGLVKDNFKRNPENGFTFHHVPPPELLVIGNHPMQPGIQHNSGHYCHLRRCSPPRKYYCGDYSELYQLSNKYCGMGSYLTILPGKGGLCHKFYMMFALGCK